MSQVTYTVENAVLEIGTVKSVSLISNLYLVVTVNFQYYTELGNPVSRFPRADFL